MIRGISIDILQIAAEGDEILELITSEVGSPRHLVQEQVVPVFTGIQGLGRITVFGGPDLEYTVVLDPKALTTAGLNAGDVLRSSSAPFSRW